MLIKSSSKLDRSLAEPKFCTLKPVDHLIDPKGYQYRCYNLIFKVRTYVAYRYFYSIKTPSINLIETAINNKAKI